jgi:hypothetical protein
MWFVKFSLAEIEKKSFAEGNIDFTILSILDNAHMLEYVRLSISPYRVLHDFRA